MVGGPAKAFFGTTMFKRLLTYFRDSREELRRVSWPNRKETTKHTLQVIGVSLGMAIFLGVIDYALNVALERVIE